MIISVTGWTAWTGKPRNVQCGQVFKTCERSVGHISVQGTQLRCNHSATSAAGNLPLMLVNQSEASCCNKTGFIKVAAGQIRP